jgi:hypothetical protein
MALPAPPSLATETALCFQHARRIITASGGSTGAADWAGCEQLALYWMTHAADIPRVRAACIAAEVTSTPILRNWADADPWRRRTTCRRCSWP